MRLNIVQEALKKKKIKYEYTEIDGCGSIDFLFRGLKFHVWEYEDREWGAETNIYEAGRSQDIEGDYEEAIAKEILSWPDMLKFLYQFSPAQWITGNTKQLPAFAVLCFFRFDLNGLSFQIMKDPGIVSRKIDRIPVLGFL